MPASSALHHGHPTATQGQREFSTEDFPALSPFQPPPQALNAASRDDHLHHNLSTLAQGVNGMSLTGRTAAAAAAGQGQEQASALAALQAQQHHRANLLGAMNGSAQRQAPSSGAGIGSQGDKQQPWAASPSPAPSSFPSSLSSNGQGQGSIASSPLPPSASAAAGLGSLDQMRSPLIGNSVPTGAAALLAQHQQQQQQQQQGPHSVGTQTPRSVSSVASSALPPPPPPLPPTSTSNPNSTNQVLPPPSSNAANNATTTTTTTAAGQVPQTPAQQVLFSPADRFGLIGLLHLIKAANTDAGMLALGNDLTNLGLDLGAPENLYSSFITPWSDSKAAQMLNIEPEFHLPSCYNVQPPAANTKIGNFSDETLFFIFYSQPRDAMQEMAAHELYKHNWRYHKELKLWLTKEAGTEPVQKTATYERGSYIFFDPVLWERVRRDFILQFDQLETRRA
ncbi:hypothetical protein JCM10212_005000 [Sporobolomyces blumeae]